MRCLVTTSRMPFALDEIRKLGRTGHVVFASDTFRSAPGSHSRYVERAFVTPSPRFAPEAFIARISALARRLRIDLIVPTFEESLLLARHAKHLPSRLFAPSFETLRMLHHKVAFLEFARNLGLPTPLTEIAYDERSLREAIERHRPFFARPALSRGGVDLLTDTGPLAGAMRIEDCRPTRASPWIVQPFVDGLDVCTFSVAHEGRLAAHTTYVHPREIEHAGGIVFESVDEPAAQAIAARIAEATGYDGQLSLDLRRTVHGLVLIECNPRPTAGALLLTDEEFASAVAARPGNGPVVAAPGRMRKMSFALIRDMVLHWRDVPKDLHHLLGPAGDVYAERGDPWPALYQVISYGHVLRYRTPPGERHRSGTRLVRGYLDDVSIDEPLPTVAA